jgi:hypothetical protein
VVLVDVKLRVNVVARAVKRELEVEVAGVVVYGIVANVTKRLVLLYHLTRANVSGG